MTDSTFEVSLRARCKPIGNLLLMSSVCKLISSMLDLMLLTELINLSSLSAFLFLLLG